MGEDKERIEGGEYKYKEGLVSVWEREERGKPLFGNKSRNWHVAVFTIEGSEFGVHRNGGYLSFFLNLALLTMRHVMVGPFYFFFYFNSLSVELSLDPFVCVT
jgi:hypothetical protein